MADETFAIPGPWCIEHQRYEDSEAHDLARQDEYEGTDPVPIPNEAIGLGDALDVNPMRTDPQVAMRCNCENEACENTQHIVRDDKFTQCPRTATQAASYIGGICDTCAEYLPDEYLHGPLTELEPEPDPFAGIVDVPTNDGWDAR